MKLLIESPTWLGDAVMASGSIEGLLEYFKPKKSILFGSFVSTELFKEKFDEVIVDDRKHRFRQFFKIPSADLFISFRGSLYSKVLGLKAKKSFTFDNNFSGHMVEKYSKYVNSIINENKIYNPKLDFKPFEFAKPTIGINPGATYGSAKRWYPEKFAEVGNYFKNYKLIIFGGPGEEEIAKDIEKNLDHPDFLNLCGRLNIKELCQYIGGLSLFVTNDSGPMHIAAAYNVPIVAVFGPTDYTETSPWSKNYKIVTKNLECAPCKKRECPLKSHECMKSIEAGEVIEAAKELLIEK
ncbi:MULTISPECIES: lipopolysaccharide heptosyltransferase II [unclassified Lebetimonas]|uniref:lipopolysaccharide heptosyltransferase II n=1 Tax=unclassified Lebetimonas TaxID=2648158 RepID=UPI0004665D96|nr:MULTISPECIES: lipopolysaccharide heptosyltransferase II [unclassified Lebetimonas]